MPSFTLSLVIVARNEAKNIARCIESALAAAREIEKSEIILVDSLSQDETVAIAQRYPIKIRQLLPEQRISSWAARYLGTSQARGELIQFLDGDMILRRDWIAQAAPYLLQDEAVVAVLGRLDEIYVSCEGNERRTDNVLRSADRVQENPRWVGGAMLCHRERLQRIGAFNPFLFGEGEAEMCFRAELHRLKVLALPLDMVEHYSAPREAWAELRRKYRNKMYLGFGQALRYHYKKPQAYKLLLRRRNHLLGLALFASALLAIATAFLFSSLKPLLLWLTALAGYFAILLLRYKSLKQAFFNLATKMLFMLGTIRGFFCTPKPVQTFPMLLGVIK
jgi:glycosyltransferase involved in cell wall biosynthesis